MQKQIFLLVLLTQTFIIKSNFYEKAIENKSHNYVQQYESIEENINILKAKYRNDLELSSCDMKDLIIQDNTTLYPFLSYHQTIKQEINTVHQHLQTVNDILEELESFKNTIQQNSIIADIQKRGQTIKKELQKIGTILLILRCKITLFKEFNDDFIHWKHEQEQQIPLT